MFLINKIKENKNKNFQDKFETSVCSMIHVTILVLLYKLEHVICDVANHKEKIRDGDK